MEQYIMAKNINIKAIDFKNLPYQSRLVQLGMGAVIIIVIVILAYLFIYNDSSERINQLKQEEETLKESYAEKSAKAANLDKLKAELDQINGLFQVLLKQLPTTAEIPNLLQELHECASKNGLTMDSITPAPIIHTNSAEGQEQQVIETLPYNITLTGNYDQITQFVRDVGKLSRIVTINSIALSRNEKENKYTLVAIANTYKALNDNEMQGQSEKK